LGGSFSEIPRDLVIDRSENVITVGAFELSGDFDSSPETYTLSAPFGGNVYISKLDSQGNFFGRGSCQVPLVQL